MDRGIGSQGGGIGIEIRIEIRIEIGIGMRARSVDPKRCRRVAWQRSATALHKVGATSVHSVHGVEFAGAEELPGKGLFQREGAWHDGGAIEELRRMMRSRAEDEGREPNFERQFGGDYEDEGREPRVDC